MEYQKYQHVQKLGNSETNGILDGTVYIFPKLDGTNAHVWRDSDGVFRAGSRNRELSLDNDNAGFCQYALEHTGLQRLTHALCEDVCDWHVYGEWLVPHSYKGYLASAWREFYVFEIVDKCDGMAMDYMDLVHFCDDHGVEYIPALDVLENPTVQQLADVAATCGYLLDPEVEGCGEGIVIKNYRYVNKYGRQTWAKMVNENFKNGAKRKSKPNSPGRSKSEANIVATLLSDEMIDKEYQKILCENDGDWQCRMIGELLGRTWNTFVTECMWDMCKKFKQPTVDFRLLNHHVLERVKDVKKELF